MSIVTPSDTALAYLAQLTIGQQRFDISELSDSSGHSATRLGGPPRWTAGLRTLDALDPAIAALWKSIVVRLDGRINHLALYDVTQPTPRGTARGSITLSATAAIGATSLALAGLRSSGDWLPGSGFEVDTNSDGLCDFWQTYQAGAFSGVVYSRVAGVAGFAQRALATSIGGSAADAVGIAVTDRPNVTAGSAYTFSADLYGVNSTHRLELAFVNDLGSQVGSAPSADWVSAGVSFNRRSLTAVAPAGAVKAVLFIYMHTGTGASPEIQVDNVQFEQAAAATAYGSAPGLLPPTLLVGDWLQISTGVGSHYCMVTADATANDIGAVTVSIKPPPRKSFSGGTAVVWDKPLCHMKQRPDSASWSGAAGSADVGGFALDLMEDWSA